MAIFEVGKCYGAADMRYDPVTVTKRTEKCVCVTNGHANWRMRVRYDNDGNEYVVDSSEPVKYRDGATYSAKWEEA